MFFSILEMICLILFPIFMIQTVRVLKDIKDSLTLIQNRLDQKEQQIHKDEEQKEL